MFPIVSGSASKLTAEDPVETTFRLPNTRIRGGIHLIIAEILDNWYCISRRQGSTRRR